MDNVENYNYSFRITLLITLLLVFLSIFILGDYYRTHEYTKVNFEDHEFFVPMGFNYKIMDEKFKYLYIYNESIGYDVRTLDDSYEVYKKNNFANVEYLLERNDYKKDFIKEITHNNISAIISKFTTEDDKSYYLYFFDYPKSNDILYGYIYQDNVSDEEFNTLFDILEHTK